MKSLHQLFCLSGLLACTLSAFAAGTGTDTAITLKALLKDAENLSGKEVLVDGLVTGVCHSGGKKAFIKDQDPASKTSIRVERTGEAKTFSQENKGDLIRVRGIVRTFKIDKAYLDSWEARSKAVVEESKEHKHGEKEDCNHECSEEKASPAALKRIATYRAMLEKTKRPHLLILWIDGTQWEVIPHKE